MNGTATRRGRHKTPLRGVKIISECSQCRALRVCQCRSGTWWRPRRIALPFMACFLCPGDPVTAMRSFQETLKHICSRPEMYVGERRFTTVAAWIGGYYWGLHQNKGADDNPIGLDGFRLWLSDKFAASHGIEPNLGWWLYLVRLYPEDEEALEQLPILYSEFAQQRISQSASR